jgi:hypothetical protein
VTVVAPWQEWQYCQLRLHCAWLCAARDQPANGGSSLVVGCMSEVGRPAVGIWLLCVLACLWCVRTVFPL